MCRRTTPSALPRVRPCGGGARLAVTPGTLCVRDSVHRGGCCYKLTWMTHVGSLARIHVETLLRRDSRPHLLVHIEASLELLEGANRLC